MPVTILPFLQFALGAATLASQVISSNREASARKEANAISGANEESRNRLEKRKAAREERIRRGRLRQSAVNTGVAGSSGELGASSSLAASFAGVAARQDADIKATRGLTAQNQVAADARSAGETAKAFGKLGGITLDFLGSETDLFSVSKKRERVGGGK